MKVFCEMQFSRVTLTIINSKERVYWHCKKEIEYLVNITMAF